MIVIEEGKVFIDDKLYEVDLGIENGKVSWLGKGFKASSVEKVIKAKELWILPGNIDAHVHCEAPANPETEDFVSGSRAAAAGGITTILEMPISKPPVYKSTILENRRKLGERDLIVDFCLYAVPDRNSWENTKDLVRRGAVAFKIFLTSPQKGREKEFGPLCYLDDGELYEVFKMIAKTKLPCSVHCEDGAIIRKLEQEITAMRKVEGKKLEYRDHGRIRPKFLEHYAAQKVILMAKETGAWVHLAHTSCSTTVNMVTEAKRKGVKISVETCPSYLTFDISAMDKYGPYAKIDPPLRDQKEVDGMWEKLERGEIDLVASDHAPYTPNWKEKGWDNILDAYSGLPGIEITAPLLYSAVLEGKISLTTAIKVLSYKPARLFGLDSQKGSLQPGHDADFVFFDPNSSWTVDTQKLFTKGRNIAKLWDGRTFKGRIVKTFVRGKCVYSDGDILEKPGFGVFLRPQIKGYEKAMEGYNA